MAVWTLLRRLRVGRAYTEQTSLLSVPLLFWTTGVCSIVLGLWRVWVVHRWILSGFVGPGPVIACVHLFTLGGLTMLMMGALYQLVPVLTNSKPVSFHRIIVQWAFFTFGTAFFVVGVNNDWTLGIATGATVMVVGIIYFVANLAGRVWREPEKNITTWFFASSLAYLSLTIVIGGFLALHLSTGSPVYATDVAAHITVALGGWVGLLLIGVSYRLWAMFGRKHREPRYWLLTWGLANLAIWLLVAGNLATSKWLCDVGWLTQVAAFLGYFADLVAAGLGDRRTMRDPALQTVAVSIAFLIVWEVLGTTATFQHHSRLWIPALWAYGLGWTGMSFMGFVQKIMPFMVWLHRYAHVHGKGKMPRLENIWRPAWGYAPMISAGLGISVFLVAYGTNTSVLFGSGLCLQVLAWLMLLGMGVRSILGPHRKPD
ncbi:MAG: hypothetical protein C7B46_20130 [Sulfobacillus benefaciens]|uniref:Uncharacterized protein n=1 Tax=Sulfobacillus benefaciens TaxID=453960 RepID=A0A2T2WVI1_9FIRM|nr:MAG: hypothetical protein C7B46_20130 [Sulfobacillus benefaciens]